MVIFRSILVILFLVAGMVEGQFPFSRFYRILWGSHHATILNNETIVELLLDQHSGAGFVSKEAYLSGLFHIKMKLPENKSPGVVASFYLWGNKHAGKNSHDELDLEFRGTNGQYDLDTNVFANDLGGREQCFRLWFDPSADFHSYNIIWNAHTVMFFVDDIPIRVFKNHRKEGVNFPNGPMKVYASIWNTSWAGAIDWAKGPFKVQYKDFLMGACLNSSGPVKCASPGFFWNRFVELNQKQRQDYNNVKKKYLIYDYCVHDHQKKECQLPNY